MGAKRILVTGGAGFAGSHLCERLLLGGHRVTALDDLSTGSYANLAHLSRFPGFSFVEHDVMNPFEIQCDEILQSRQPWPARRITSAIRCAPR